MFNRLLSLAVVVGGVAVLMSNPVKGFVATPSTPRTASSTSLRMAVAPEPTPEHTRRAAALHQFGVGAVVSAAWLGLAWPAPAQAKKVTNLEEARERGEKKMEEIERAKGPLIKVKDGVKYREELVGKGDGFEKGDLVKIRYQVYKGNGDYMFSTGYGREFQNDVGDTYDFTFGRPNSIPKGAEMGMEGMRVGGKRKILVPADLGWSTSGGLPEPQTYGGKRKLLNNIDQPLQFEVELIRVKKRNGGNK